MPSSVPLARGGGETGSGAAGATQPEVELVPLGVAANRLYSSLLTGSTGLLSNGRAKRATCSPTHLERGAGAVGDSKQEHTLLSSQIPTGL